MKNIIFLDFDGVLNTDHNQNLFLYHGKAWKDKYGALFGLEAVVELERIVKETEAGIVIESSWKYLGLEAMQQKWNDRNMSGNVIDIIKKNKMKRTCFFAAVAMLLMTACATVRKPEHMRVVPLDSGLNLDSLSDCTIAVGFKAGDIDWNGGRMTCSVFSKDLYDAVEVSRMRPGDTLVYDGKPMVIDSIAEYRSEKVVNGGIENGGAELAPNGGGTYRTMLWDDHSVFTKLGDVQLRLAPDLIFIDCGDDYRDPSDTIRTNYKEYIDRLPDYRKDYFNCLNTELVVEGGAVIKIHRRWIP